MILFKKGVLKGFSDFRKSFLKIFKSQKYFFIAIQFLKKNTFYIFHGFI